MIVFLAGPIEHWWNCKEDPARFVSNEAFAYRQFRAWLSARFVKCGCLVFRPHEAFKGTWNEDAQKINDRAIEISDIVVDMSPPGIPGEGTRHEVEYARSLGKEVYSFTIGQEEFFEQLLDLIIFDSL